MEESSLIDKNSAEALERGIEELQQDDAPSWVATLIPLAVNLVSNLIRNEHENRQKEREEATKRQIELTRIQHEHAYKQAVEEMKAEQEFSIRNNEVRVFQVKQITRLTALGIVAGGVLFGLAIVYGNDKAIDRLQNSFKDIALVLSVAFGAYQLARRRNRNSDLED
jgi:hypothetical protein